MKQILLIVVVLFSATLFLSRTRAQTPQYVDLDYDKYQFLVADIDYEVCMMVPNPPSMEMISADGYIPKDACSQSKFFGHVLVSILPLPILAFLVLFGLCCCCPCICASRYKLGFFGGGRPTAVRGLRGCLLPGNEADALRSGYTRTEILCNKVALGVLFVGLMAAGGLIMVATEMTAQFIWEAKKIFDTNPIYAIETVYTTNQVISTLNYTNSPAALQIQQQNMDIAYKLQHTAQTEITDKLDAFTTVVQVAMDGTVVVMFIILLLALFSAMLHLPKLAIVLALLLMPLMILVWLDFSVVYGANNIIHKMCSTINPCHFCYEGMYPPHNNGSVNCGQYCNVPWFQTMSECTPEDAARFYSLENLIQTASDMAATGVCANISSICNSGGSILNCAFANGPCNANNLAAVTLDGIVAIEVQGNPPVWNTVATLVNNSAVNAQVQRMASDAVSEYGLMTQYSAQLLNVQTLDCSSNNAFIESVGGTFDALQKHLCPEINHPRRDIHEILTLLAVGLIIVCILLPCLQCVLCLGDKRFRKHARKLGSMEDYGSDETVGLVGAINTTKSPPASRTGSIFD